MTKDKNPFYYQEGALAKDHMDYKQIEALALIRKREDEDELINEEKD